MRSFALLTLIGLAISSSVFALGGGGTPPSLGSASFLGQTQTQLPFPNANLAVGPTRVLEVTDERVTVYTRMGGTVLTQPLWSFLPGATLTPCVAYDASTDRWLAAWSDFGTTIHVSASRTPDPTGPWFHTSFTASAGSDAGKAPSWLRMTHDAIGIYISAWMAGSSGSSSSIFVFNKSPLLATVPSLGAVTAFRNLTNDYLIRPCDPLDGESGVYFLTHVSSSVLHVRRIDPSPFAPTLVDLGFVGVPPVSPPVDAQQAGSGILIDTGDTRLTCAVRRGNCLWTAHTISSAGRCAVRWYQVRLAPLGLVQSGLIDDAQVHFYTPSLCVDANGNVVIGFSGSSSGLYPGAFFTGRASGDPNGQTGPIMTLAPGLAPFGTMSPATFGRTSACVVDPIDGTQIWTVQNFATTGGSPGRWSTIVAALAYPSTTGSGFCFGYGPAENTCPCQNASAPGSQTGCLNSLGLGAKLVASGAASVAGDSLVLVGSQMPDGPVLYFQGTSRVNNGLGAHFGDGLRCASGTTIRLATQTNLGGVSQYPESGELGVAVRGMVSPGSARHYQAWYRNPATYCTSFTFNLTNGWTVTWGL